MTNCEIIKDLLPLFKDEVVSASSIKMIEEHLKTCENCKAEFEKLHGEVKVSFNPEQNAEIGAFRLFKKKLLKRNAVVACTSVVLVVVLLFGTYLYMDNNTTIIPYKQGLIVTVKANPDRGIIDVVSRIKPEGWNVASITVNENGENVKIIAMNFTESVISGWQNNHSDDFEYNFQVLQPMARPASNPEDKPEAYSNYEPFDRCEIYYVNEWGLPLENNYQRVQLDGNLIWSGKSTNGIFTDNINMPQLSTDTAIARGSDDDTEPSITETEVEGFTVNFAGNTSVNNTLTLNSEYQYFYIKVVNTGDNIIGMTIGNDSSTQSANFYQIPTGTYYIWSTKEWSATSQYVSFSSNNGMFGNAYAYLCNTLTEAEAHNGNLKP